MADTSGSRGIVTLVCLTCGNEKSFVDSVPETLTCDKCGATVFRQFDTAVELDDVSASLPEEQKSRNIAYGDASPSTTKDEVRDLDSR